MCPGVFCFPGHYRALVHMHWPKPSSNYFIMKREQLSKKSASWFSKQSLYSSQLSDLHGHLDHLHQLASNLATTRGASAWLFALPLTEYSFSLHKSEFHDAIALCYGWPLSQTLSHGSCGVTFSVNYALSYPRGGVPSLHRNEIRDLTASLLSS